MIEVIKQDITTLEVDAIVNAANRSLMGGGGVDGAIHRAAGPRLKEYNRSLGGCETGEAKISPGFNLNARWIIHTVGPIWQGGEKGEDRLLNNCYENCLSLAINKGIQSIAFPCISTGIYGYPKREAAGIAVNAIRQYQDKLDRVIVCCFSGEDSEIYLELV